LPRRTRSRASVRLSCPVAATPDKDSSKIVNNNLIALIANPLRFVWNQSLGRV
jgi:hypothetical protein